jgi:transcriptional regulator of acetoin/glycerol metabolism
LESLRKSVLSEPERKYVLHVLTAAKGNVTAAAQLAGVTRVTFYKLMKVRNVSVDDIMKPSMPRE